MRIKVIGIWGAIGSFCFLLTPQMVRAVSADSCECPQLSCDSCSQQQGLTFYTEKCAAGTRVKSCAKPTCVRREPAPEGCLQARAQSPKREVASNSKQKVLARSVKAEIRGPQVARIKVVKGRAWLVPLGSQKQKLKAKMVVHEKDTLMTGKNGQVALIFSDGNELNLSPNSKIKLTTVISEAKENRRQTLLDLLKGRVRNKVKQKYKGANYFHVRTKTAVAGVRGTDFVVDYMEGEKVVTQVSTLTGEVELTNPGKEQAIEISAGHSGSYVVAAANVKGVFSDDEIKDFVQKGYMTPVYKMTEKELKELEWKTEVKPSEKVQVAQKPMEEFVCKSPKAHLNQCAWECLNNPKEATRCRTDLPQVNCVRRRCNANGNWAEEIRLPASFYDACEPTGHKVGTCDY